MAVFSVRWDGSRVIRRRARQVFLIRALARSATERSEVRMLSRATLSRSALFVRRSGCQIPIPALW